MSETENVVGPPIVVATAVTNHNNWKWQLVTAARQLLVAVVTSAIVIGGLVLGFHGQSADQAKLAEDTLHANLAQACVLALPVDLDTGRNPQDVKLCFTQYGLEPPSIVRSGE